jgi:hypothetical protein
MEYFISAPPLDFEILESALLGARLRPTGQLNRPMARSRT